MKSFPIAVSLLLAVGVTSAFAADEGSGDSKIWNGVFTAAQAQRGKDSFEKSCSNCHQSDLAGTVRAPALKGERFMKDWQNGSVNALFVKIRDSMPASYPETVPEEIKIDILSYLLQQNGFPAGGSAELKIDEKALEDIQIVQKGEQKAANFTTVRMVGCLTQGAGNRWTLTRSSDPVVTKDDTATPAAVQEAQAKPLGSGTFELVSVGSFKPDVHKGQKVEARGLIYREGSTNLLTVTSIETAGSCGN